MRGHTRKGSAPLAALLAALLCLTAVGAVAAPVGAQNGDIDGEVGQTDSGGLEVEIQNGTGPFQGGAEQVTIGVNGATFQQTRGPIDEGVYLYRVGAANLSETGTLATDDLSAATVTVEHESGANFTKEVDLRHARFEDSVSIDDAAFTDDGDLRVDLGVAVGLPEGTTLQATVGVGGTTEDDEVTLTRVDNTSAVVIDRETLDERGLLDNPREVTIEGSEAYFDGAATVDVREVAATETTATRDAGRLVLSNPLFEGGRSYVVDARPTNGDAQYLVTVDADGDGASGLRLNSSALLAASEIEATVERNGNVLLDTERVPIESQELEAAVDGDRTTVSIEGLEETGKSVATLWVNTTDSGIQRYDASLNASTGTLSLSGGESLPSTATALLIEFGNGESAYATLDSGGSDSSDDDAAVADPDDGPLAGLVQFLPGDSIIPVAIAGIVGLVLVIGLLAAAFFVRNGSLGGSWLPIGGGSSSPGTSPDQAPTVDVTVDVVDERLGESYVEADAVLARKADKGGRNGGGIGGRNRSGRASGGSRNRGYNTGGSAERIALEGGEGRTELEVGTWQFEVKEGDQTIAKKGDVSLEPGIDRDRIPITVPPRKVTAQVTGGLDNEPLDGARVRAEPDVGAAKPPKPLPTDPSGRATFQVPQSASAVTFSAEYEDLPGEQTTVRADRAAQEDVKVEITAETGTLEIQTKVGTRAWPSVAVEVTPVDGDAVAYAEPGHVTTDESGISTQEVPVGRYELAAHPEIRGVETQRSVQTATVEADRTTTATLAIEASFSLSSEQQARRTALRDRIETLSTEPDHDVAIPYYYGTVLESVLGLTEELESNPERVLAADIEPGRAVDAVLEAVDVGIDAVEGPMSEWRNIKLFRGLDSLPDVEESWRGDVDLESFLDRVSEGEEHQRRALRDQLTETDEFLDKRWSEVGEIGPARKVHDEVGDLARASGDEGELTAVAQAYVGVCLLDAVESLFEHDALRDRLDGGGR